MARMSRPMTANKIHVVTVHDPNWDAFVHAAHASQLGSCNYNVHVHVDPYLYTVHFVLHFCGCRGYRLQDMVKGVYCERSRLRKHMVDLDTRERETLLRVCRKVGCAPSPSHSLSLSLSLSLIQYMYMYVYLYMHLLEVTKQQTCMKHSYCAMY